jgi:hypothetical protein
MKTSKTLKLIRRFHEDVGGNPQEDVTEAPQQTPDTMPMTSDGENEYISDMIDAALFSPSSEDAQTLLNLQSVMKLKRFTNAREEILPTILGIIRSESESKDMKSNLNHI